jgi:hypothetical protein
MIARWENEKKSKTLGGLTEEEIVELDTLQQLKAELSTTYNTVYEDWKAEKLNVRC